ncbi:hypothetical protein D6C95_10239 [Aureobasidium pullulans]|nr:hypothetical protein D6C95_10239 [Aureobasidium pullulans]
MANDRNNRQSIEALPDGIAGKYFTILKSIYEGFGHLAAIIDYWNDHHPDKYRLIRDEGEPRAWTKVMNHKSRTVLVRSVRCRWQPCGYFEKSETIKRLSVESRLAARRTDAASTLTKPQSILRLQFQTSANPDTGEPASEIIKTAATIGSNATKLHTTCAKLDPAVEEPAEALVEYEEEEGALQTATEKITAAVQQTTLAEHQRPRRATAHDTTPQNSMKS